MARGYMGKILSVDLAAGTIQEEVLDEQLCRDYIGGYGLGARLLYERMPAGADPLGPDNILGILTGPLTGTPAIIGSRFVAVAKSPNTGGPIAGHNEVVADGAGVSFASHICDVEVDPETGKTKVLRYTVIQDAGKAIVGDPEEFVMHEFR